MLYSKPQIFLISIYGLVISSIPHCPLWTNAHEIHIVKDTFPQAYSRCSNSSNAWNLGRHMTYIINDFFHPEHCASLYKIHCLGCKFKEIRTKEKLEWSIFCCCGFKDSEHGMSIFIKYINARSIYVSWKHAFWITSTLNPVHNISFCQLTQL